MKKARLRVMAGLAGAALSLFAITSSAQNTNTPPAGSSDPAAQTAAPAPTAQPTTPPSDASVPAQTDAGSNSSVTRSTATDVTTTDTSTTSFPGGVWGIIAVGLLVILALFGIFRGRDRTVVKESYTSNNTSNTVPSPRPTGMGTATGDRTLNTRVASDTGANRGGASDPNART
jgi:hypothetical protein